MRITDSGVVLKGRFSLEAQKLPYAEFQSFRVVPYVDKQIIIQGKDGSQMEIWNSALRGLSDRKIEERVNSIRTLLIAAGLMEESSPK